MTEARRFEIHGTVQGVGFRPFVWRLATRHGLTGWVRNDGGAVTVHAEGEPISLDAFAAGLAAEAPPLARVDAVTATAVETGGHVTFMVDDSLDVPGGERLVSPDAATCAGCLAELFDPVNRRYRYPFINCTDCGPRFTIIDGLPYDRERTSMRVFPMCEACRREYEDPGDRRFHAEPVACPACGPRVRLVGPGAARAAIGADTDPIRAAAALLREGAIVALKGLGGFHLACDATNEETVTTLRARKRRPDKPFAVMVASPEGLPERFAVTPVELAVLGSWQAPIVLVEDRGALAPSVAPGHRRQGAMLPSTPLHHLLTREVHVPLVMTSGNAADEPICIADEEAFERLESIADAFLVHDRAIVARYDDSVVRVRTGGHAPSVLRRARSFAPHPLMLAHAVADPILGTGAELHGAFCLAQGHRAYLSQHIGDLQTEEAMAAYRAAYDRYRNLLGIEPALVAHDLHPDLLTTRFAEELGIERVAVQHHHAHVAATMAEHGLDGKVLGLAFDGLGLGEDGTIWGGELLLCTRARAVRVGRLRPVRQPGGDAATWHPWRMAIAHAADADVLEQATGYLGIAEPEVEVVLGQIASGLASPMTSSAGRLFDAVAALLGVCDAATYDGQAAMLLEQIARPARAPAYARVGHADGLVEIDTRDLIASVVDQLRARAPMDAIAGVFHASLADVVARACDRVRERVVFDRVVLGGGVFANDLFTSTLVTQLTDRGYRVFLPQQVPVGDGGIALGQVTVAAARGA